MRQKTIKAIQEHAAAEYPREACGLVAQRGRAERYFPCRNLATESKDNFVLAPEDYAEVEEWGAIIGIVHSHPDATTQPSELDKAQCDATLSPGILSAGQKAISVPSTRVVSCRSSSDHSCWATTIAGAW
jgi:proteasome lid subunit RPN8/RPN11